MDHQDLHPPVETLEHIINLILDSADVNDVGNQSTGTHF
jgi:hypothetical protein